MPCSETSAANPLAFDDDDEVHVLYDDDDDGGGEDVGAPHPAKKSKKADDPPPAEEAEELSDTETEVDEEDEDAAFSAAAPSHLGSPDTDGEAAAAPGALASIVEEICRLGTFRGVGLIVGPTGSGKTRLLNALVKRGVVNPAAEKEVWPEHRTVVSALAERCGGVQAAMSRLNAVGLNTVPEWVKPFSALSNGQQARAPAHTRRRRWKERH